MLCALRATLSAQEKFLAYRVRFGGLLGAYLAHLEPQDGAKTRPRPTKNSTKMVKILFYAEETPESAQEPSKTPPGRWSTPLGIGF